MEGSSCCCGPVTADSCGIGCHESSGCTLAVAGARSRRVHLVPRFTASSSDTASSAMQTDHTMIHTPENQSAGFLRCSLEVSRGTDVL